MDSSVPTIGYWPTRGLAQYIRLTFEASGKAYNMKIYTSPDDWFGKDKPCSPVLLPNLPYYIDGDIAIAEVDSIVRTVARLYNPDLLGKTSKDQAFVENIASFVFKWNSKIRPFCYTDADEEGKKKFIEEVKP